MCGESYEDEWLLVAHQELIHNIQPLRQSVIHYAPRLGSQSLPTSSTLDTLDQPAGLSSSTTFTEALEGKTVRHYKISNVSKMNLNNFIKSVQKDVIIILNQELARLNFIKFGLVLDATFTNVQNEISPRSFITKNKSIMQTTNVSELLKDSFEEIVTKITEHEGRGSGWSLLNVIGIDVRVHKHGYGDRGSSYIPLPPKLKNTHALINIKNTDNECFRYSVLCKFIKNNPRNDRPNRKYKELRSKYNFKGITYPVSLLDIKKFEHMNPGVSINVFALDNSNNIYPLKIVDNELNDHTDLLLLKKGDISHYVFIKDFNSLIARQVTKSKNCVTVCKRCFGHVDKSLKQGGFNWLVEHNQLCVKKQPVKIILPSKKNAYVKFNKVSHQYRVPIVVYADFEASLLPIETLPNPEGKQIKYQTHEPNSYCILLKSYLTEEHLNYFGLSSKPKVYRGSNAAKMLLDDLYNIAANVEMLYNYKVPMNNLDVYELEQHESATSCCICSIQFSDNNRKVRDHDHLTGKYRGPTCNNCNINFKLPTFIPVIFHNLSGYDSHFIIPELGRDQGKIDVIATTTEKFISFSKKVNKLKLRFLDSYKFVSSSLQKLAENLSHNDFVETRQIVPADKLSLVLRKGVYPYEYIDSLAKFNETSLPPITAFFSKLNDTHISQNEYNHACKVWTELNMKTLGDYNDFYVKLDVTLLCDIMEDFRNNCFSSYGLDPLHSYTSPGLAWQAMLKETKCVLELLTDIDMVLMVEAGVRGGLTQCVTRHVKANNKYIPSFDPTKKSTYLGYFDSNNLYGFSMSQPLPYGNFKWIDPTSLPDVMQIPQNGDIGYIIEADYEYPDSLHDYHYDLPFLPQSMIPPEGKHSKLMMTLENKTKYIAHFWIVQQALHAGLVITKIHRVLQFSQSCWLKPYISNNTIRRASAVTSSQKEFYKLMNNAIFGKTLENKRKHKDVKLVRNDKNLIKLVQKPNFKTSIIINNTLVAVCMDRTFVKMNRPLYVGMCILDISKTHMYDFHYNKMVPFYGRENIGITYTDTDAYLYFINTMDMYEDLRTFPYKNDFDFSDYDVNHPNYDNGINKKVLGKFKDETNGVPIVEMVGLMPKMYALKLLSDSEEDKVIKKAKGIKAMYVKKNIMFDMYKECLFENKTFTAEFNNIRSFNHKIFSISERKKSLSSTDDKRKVLNDNIHTLPYGHYSLKKTNKE